MNLAEIRKKANRDRDEAANTPVRGDASVAEVYQATEVNIPERDAVRIDLHVYDEPDLEPVEDVAGTVAFDSAFLNSSIAVEPEPRETIVVPPPIKAPAIPASAAMEYSASLAEPVAPVKPDAAASAVSAPESEDYQDHHFDPLAILLAGRASSGFGDELVLSSDEISEADVLDYQEFLCFRVCNEQYAINIMEIKEIIKPREITEVPRVPEFISGVLSLRGIIIPVFNMGMRLHLEPVAAGTKERIIVVSKGEELFGIQVDEVLQVVRIPEGGIEQPPAVLEGIDRDFVQGIGRHPSGMLILLNLASILDVSLY
jgi:purine-binding chemotaxis protein CheW